MGILNCTPDSFFDGGTRTSLDAHVAHCARMIAEGAAIIDIGGYSTRPGYAEISEEEELRRLLPVVRAVRKNFPDIAISIDTFRSGIVRSVYAEIGTIIVNDISGGEYDSEMLETCGKLALPYICMHLQDVTQSTDFMSDMQDFFAQKNAVAQQYNIPQLLLDPGFGFGKTIAQQYELLRRMNEFAHFNLPILAGLSRKSMIWKTLHCTPQEALNGTTILNTLALSKGAAILRVHDVKQAMECVRLLGFFAS
jgi:dihydropteroate synthase